MLKNVIWSANRDYKTGSENEPLQFYIDSLCNSSSFDLLLGYFSSSAINILSLGFANFLYSGGKMRMAINNILSAQDKEAIEKGQKEMPTASNFTLDDITALRTTLDEYGKHFFECLAWLIANQRIEIKVIQPKGQGMSHFKLGIFSDGKDNVCFNASCNFTAFGLLENLESLDCSLSWDDKRSENRNGAQSKYFNSIFNEQADFVNYLNLSDIEIAIRTEFGDKTINELLIQEKELIAKKNNLELNDNLKKSIKKAIKKIESLEEIEKAPHFPFPEGPREYQLEAYDSWSANDYKGVFAMATGTGKTITSLYCLLVESNKDPEKIYHALILVPTITLVNQWEEEAKKFNFNDVIKISSKYSWETELSTLLSTAKRMPTSFIIISTYASFIKDRFNKYMKLLPEDTMFIADEAHNIGSQSVLNQLNLIKSEKRIGLSATPKRIYDEEGSAAMELFFYDKEPYTYTFSMERAIEEGILCKYDYHPHIIKLTALEFEKYIEITKRLARLFVMSNDKSKKNETAERLLLQRKQIIHKAHNKLAKTIEILKNRFAEEKNLKYTFVYVPEGSTIEINEEETENEENIKIINQYTRAIGRIDESIMVNQFISGMPDRDEVLEQFKDGKIDVIASMKCLDEGVDIPRAEHAIFCSSTGNPRQFIQRRGRILRKHSEKHFAVIHDLVVIPDFENINADSDTFNTEQSMIKKELERVMYFASLSRNPYETESIFEEVCAHYDLNIYTIHNELKNG